MKERVVSSIILISLAIAGIIYYPLCGIAVMAFTLIGLYEFFSMIENKGVKLYKWLGLVVGGIIPLLTYFNLSLKGDFLMMMIYLIIFLLFSLELLKNKIEQPTLAISATILGIFYISWCLSFILKIRQLPEGIVLLSFLLLVTKLSDIGAYLWGRKYGKIPLIKVSPKKSLEGSIGGFITALIGGLIFSNLITNMSFLNKLFIIIVIAIISQLGDLFESLIKRDCQIKDSGSVMPGMGGALDVMDSVIFTAPIFYFFLNIL